MMDVGTRVSLKLLTAQKIKSFILDISNKRDQIHRKLQIGPHLRKKSWTGEFIFSVMTEICEYKELVS